MTIKVLLDAKPKVPKKKQPIKLTKLDKLSPVSLGSPTDDYNNLMAKQNAPSGSQIDWVRWAPTPQIARIDEIPSTPELQYPLLSLESQIAKDQAKNKNWLRPPPSNDSLIPYEEAFTAESFEKRSEQPSSSSPATAELSSYAVAAKCFYEKLPTPEWMAERKRKAQANIRPATKPNQFFV
ncbi:hypothetical protein AX15_005909 [Amanita polypyramis BW_CC]|nr:hypothetical protein AX15_005909 [Amanita polypyramis BW_CC]